MSNNDELFDEVIRNLRSVLLSNKDGLTTRKLQSDYRDLICEDIPFRKLGYSSLDAFLQKIPSVVQGQYSYAGFLWFGIADKTSEHIREMIDRQIPKKGRNRPFLPPPRSSYSYQQYSKPVYTTLKPQAPRMRIDIPRFQREFNQICSSQPQPQQRPPKRESYNQVKPQIRLLFEKYPGGIRLSEFPYKYQMHFRQCLVPEDYGYGSIEDFVLSLQGLVRVRNTGRELVLYGVGINPFETRNREWKSNGNYSNENVVQKPAIVEARKDTPSEQKSEYNLSELMFRLKITKEEGKGRSTEHQTVSTEIQKCYDEWDDSSSENSGLDVETKVVAKAVTNKPEKLEPQIKQLEYKTEEKKPDYDDEWGDPGWDEEPKSKVNTNCNSTTRTEKGAKKVVFKIDSDIEESDDCNVSKRLKMEFRQLLAKYPNGIKSNFLPMYYGKEFNKELDYQGLGYISLPDLISDVTDIFFSYRETVNSDWLLLDARKCKQFGSTSFTAESLKPMKIPEIVKIAVIKVLLNKPNGILLGKFQEEYINFLHEKVPYEDYGFRSARQFLDALTQDTINLEETCHGTVVKLLPNILHKYMPPLSGSAQKAMLRLQPNDIVKPGEDIPLQPLPDTATSGKYFEVIISQINDPFDFYFYLRGKETSMALEKLMNALEFYDEPSGGDYILPSEFLKPGQICAALYEKDWHRAIISRVTDSDVTVFYLDYGTVGTLPKSDIRFLRSKFTKLPAQAHAAQLWNVEPYGKEWPLEGRRRFFALIEGKSLCAKLLGTKIKPISKMNSLQLCLVDTLTNDGKDLDIAKCLVDGGFCRYLDRDTDDETRRNATPNPQPTQQNIYPQPLLPYNNVCDLMHSYASYIAMSNWILNSNQFLPPVYPLLPASTATTAPTAPQVQAASASPKVNQTEKSNSPDLVSQKKSLDNLCSVLDTLTLKRYVKIVQIGEKKMHLILYNKELYTISKDISQYLWNSDLLRAKLRLKHFKVNQLMINENDHPELFTELINYNLCVQPLEVGLPHALLIYPLRHVPDIIDKFNASLSDLKAAVMHELDRFDPNDTYWGNSDDGISISEPWDALDEVEVGLQVIKSRKAAIERELLTGFKQTLVEELNFINERIVHLQMEKLK